MQRFLYSTVCAAQTIQGLQRIALISVLAGNTDEEMLLPAQFNTTHAERVYKSAKVYV
jgi:hypothetical protein